MDMMIYAVLGNNNENDAFLFFTFEDFTNAIIESDKQLVCAIELTTPTGSTREEKKASLQAKAVEYSNNQAGGLSYGELSYIQGYFEANGSRYGLLKEFKENAIC